MLADIINLYRWLGDLNWELICGAVAAVGVIISILIALWPKSAEPEVTNITFYVECSSQFTFVCQLVALNDGLGRCLLEDVDITMRGCSLEKGASVLMTRGYRTFGSTDTLPRVFTTELPVRIGKYDKTEIIVVGQGQYEAATTVPDYVEVRATFKTRKQKVHIGKRAKTITRGVRFSNYEEGKAVREEII